MCFFRKSSKILPLLFMSVEVKNTDCSICLEKLKNVTFVSLPCGHGFCSECILLWLERHQSCPMCRAKLRFVIEGKNMK